MLQGQHRNFYTGCISIACCGECWHSDHQKATVAAKRPWNPKYWHLEVATRCRCTAKCFSAASANQSSIKPLIGRCCVFFWMFNMFCSKLYCYCFGAFLVEYIGRLHCAPHIQNTNPIRPTDGMVENNEIHLSQTFLSQ